MALQAEPERTTPLLPVTMAVSFVGGLVLLVWQVVSLPSVVAIAGLTLFLVGLVLALVMGFLEARHTGDGFARSLGQGFLTLVSWAAAVVP